MDFLHDRTYLDACASLEAHGAKWLADGDWARVYSAPNDESRVVRFTPFDPAYGLYAETCLANPHPNLPRYHAILPLAGHGYAVLMDRYTPGNIATGTRFLADLKTRLDTDVPDPLTVILRRGLQIGRETIPYFGGLDDNPHNVLYDGTTPVLVDAFFQQGKCVAEGIEAGISRLTQTEQNAFFQIPYFTRK